MTTIKRIASTAVAVVGFGTFFASVIGVAPVDGLMPRLALVVVGYGVGIAAWAVLMDSIYGENK